MTRKECVLSQLDYYNAVMSGGIVGGLIGVSLLGQSQGYYAIGVLVVLGIVGYYCNKYRRGLLLELKDMD